ncbi:hypothetical protein ACOWOR_02815 [Helicobacter pylori]
MVTYEKIKSRFSRNWSLRDRGRHFASLSVYFFSLLVITVANRSSAVAWLLMPEHLIWWFLISFSGEFVADMAFGKKSKILKTRFGISIVSGISLLLGALPAHLSFVWFGFINWWAVFFIEARARLIGKLFYSNQLNKGCPYLRHRIKNYADPVF